jgi:hypothetical protein
LILAPGDPASFAKPGGSPASLFLDKLRRNLDERSRL